MFRRFWAAQPATARRPPLSLFVLSFVVPAGFESYYPEHSRVYSKKDRMIKCT